MMHLGVLDQVPHFRGRTAAEAIQESVLLAREAEHLGYQRFWIAEHHNLGHFACGAPEILVAAIAAQTTTMRVGSGGVMLPNYSPLKVAETFRLLNTLYAGRIDLGLGRSTGANGLAAQVLQPYLPPGLTGEQDPYLQQVRVLLAFLAEDQDTRQEPPAAETPYPGVRAVPVGAPTPEVWLLGSGQGSAAVAASLGLSFSFAQFVHARPEPRILETYRRNFRPSRHLPSPRTSLAVRVLCAESAEEADRLARSFWQVCMGVHQRMAAGTYP
ncbi:MAG TPA: MsnO8 family LLM class oxidoreductase, partial [Ktedonobacteraceae bacterium]|nr:MsnO8 family LLM class oxidoreductase [Ktedonobacteraceae bacterium]